MKYIDFNINDDILVKLTEAGKRELNRQDKNYTEVWQRPDVFNWKKFHPEDENGFTKWQCWDIMQKLGHMFCLGCDEPFDVNIKIGVDE